jgi:hypothetical protein
MSKTTINIKNLNVTLHIALGAQPQAVSPFDAILHAIVTGARTTHADKPADNVVTGNQTDTGAAEAPAASDLPVYQWPQEGDVLHKFDGVKNFLDEGQDADVIEVTDDYFRVKGVFTSKGDKGTRSVTLKVSRDEVADGSVKYTIDA